MKYTVKKESLPESQEKLIINVDVKDFDLQVTKSKVKVLGEAELKGFRKGHVPEAAFVEAYGAKAFRQEAAYDAVDAVYVNALVEQKIQAVGRPMLNIISFNEGEDFVFEMTVDVMPTLILGEYKNLHKEIKEGEVKEISDEDMQKVIEDLVAYRVTKDADGKEVVPELNAEFIKSLGIESGERSELEAKIRENAKLENETRVKEVRKNEIIKKIIEDAKGEVPKSFIDNELSKMKNKVTEDLSQMGVGFPEYLKHLNKSEEEWAAGETENAKKSAILQIALLQISKAENIKPSKEAVEKEVEHLKLHYKDLDIERATGYSEELMTNSMVMEYVLTGSVPDENIFFKPDHSHGHDHS